MPENEPGQPWDFLAFVAWWNLYGLPVLLFLIAAFSLTRDWKAGGDAIPDTTAKARRAWNARRFLAVVRAVALIHLALGLRNGIALAQELLTLREQGIPQSFPVTGIVLPAIATFMDLTIGHFLWRLRPWSRSAAVVWNAVVGLVAALAAAWQWRFRAEVRPDQWPDYLVSVVLPWLVVLVLSLPGTRAGFVPAPDRPADLPASPAASSPALAPWVSILLALLLPVVASTLLVDALDWLVRSLGPAA